MNNQTPPRKLVQLELSLEARAGEWDVSKRRRVGQIYLRWGRQLLISADVIEAHQSRPKEKTRLRPLPPHKQALN